MALPRIYQIKVTLQGAKPPIWRRLLVPNTLSLKALHRVIQTAMGWTDSHLHQFEAHGQNYGVPDPEYGEDMLNEAQVRLDQVLIEPKEAMVYEYDFGDGWLHKVVLEKVLEPVENVVVPSCIGGKRACPPEDCGGVYGYEELLMVMSDPSHAEYEEMRDWVGEFFDPEHFDVAKINRLLATRTRRDS